MTVRHVSRPTMPPGLTFTTFHFPELVDVNVLTNDAWDKRSGTAEFKAASIRIEPIPAEGLPAPAETPAAETPASETTEGA